MAGLGPGRVKILVVFASIERFGEFRHRSSQFMSRSRARTAGQRNSFSTFPRCVSFHTAWANSGSRPGQGFAPREPPGTISISNEHAQAPMLQMALRNEGREVMSTKNYSRLAAVIF